MAAALVTGLFALVSTTAAMALPVTVTSAAQGWTLTPYPYHQSLCGSPALTGLTANVPVADWRDCVSLYSAFSTTGVFNFNTNGTAPVASFVPVLNYRDCSLAVSTNHTGKLGDEDLRAALKLALMEASMGTEIVAEGDMACSCFKGGPKTGFKWRVFGSGN